MDIKAAAVVDRSGEQEGGNVWGGVGDGDGILLSLVTVPREGQASLGPGRAGIHSVHSRPPLYTKDVRVQVHLRCTCAGGQGSC